MNPPETAGNGPISADRPSGGYGEGDERETCLGCGLEVADDIAWKRSHPKDPCPDDCWCRAYCWSDWRCVGKPEDIRARARAEAFEEAARIADAEAEAHRLRDRPDWMDAARWVAREIRRRAKP